MQETGIVNIGSVNIIFNTVNGEIDGDDPEDNLRHDGNSALHII